MTQIDGYSEINVDRYDEMRELIIKENPDIVFTHWTLDLHRDHRVCSCLVLEAWKRLKYKFELYLFEPMTGAQAQFFHPTDYVDISSVAEKKHEACMCHVSQGMEDIRTGTTPWRSSAAANTTATEQRHSYTCAEPVTISSNQIFILL